VSTLAGSYSGRTDGTGGAASFSFPKGVAVDGSGNVYVADYYNDTIRKVTPSGAVSTIVGVPPYPPPGNFPEPCQCTGAGPANLSSDLW
jgi:hypothetical protein